MAGFIRYSTILLEVSGIFGCPLLLFLWMYQVLSGKGDNVEVANKTGIGNRVPSTCQFSNNRLSPLLTVLVARDVELEDHERDIDEDDIVICALMMPMFAPHSKEDVCNIKRQRGKGGRL